MYLYKKWVEKCDKYCEVVSRFPVIMIIFFRNYKLKKKFYFLFNI